MDKKGKIVVPHPASKEQGKANTVHAIARGKTVMGNIPYVDDLALSYEDIDASLLGVALLKPAVFATTASDELLHAVLPPNQPLLGELDDEEYPQMLKQIPVLSVVLSAAKQEQTSWQEMLRIAPQFFQDTCNRCGVFTVNFMKFPLFFYKTLHRQGVFRGVSGSLWGTVTDVGELDRIYFS